MCQGENAAAKTHKAKSIKGWAMAGETISTLREAGAATGIGGQTLGSEPVPDSNRGWGQASAAPETFSFPYL